MKGSSENDWRWECTDPSPQADVADAPFDTWRSRDGDCVVEFRRRGANYLLRFLGAADFTVDAATHHVVAVPAPGIDANALEDLYFNQVMPALLGHSGRPVIHASAVAISGRAAAFMGMTGQGKSTLAAALARGGYPFLTDDGLILDPTVGGFDVGARRPQLRLRPDSEAALTGAGSDDDENAKRRIAAGTNLPFHSLPLPLGALYWLQPSAALARPEIESLGPNRALDLILKHSFFLDVEDRASVRRAFEQAAAIAAAVPCFALDYPRDYDALPAVVAAIAAHFSEMP
jgi:hypothetical protein